MPDLPRRAVRTRKPKWRKYPTVHYELRYCDPLGNPCSTAPLTIEGIEHVLGQWGINSDRELTTTKTMPKVHIVKVTTEEVERVHFTKDAR
jgi:hypothetical protein